MHGIITQEYTLVTREIVEKDYSEPDEVPEAAGLLKLIIKFFVTILEHLV